MDWFEDFSTDKIDPQVRPPKEVADDLTAEAAFEIGNYPAAFSRCPNEDFRLRAKAQILCGAVAPGLATLEKAGLESEEDDQIASLARWCLGQDDDFSRQFQNPDTGLIDILILSMPSSDKAVEYANAKGFRVIEKCLSPEEFGTPFEEVLASLPDGFSPKLVLCLDCNGLFLPPGTFDTDIPTVFWAGDHDYFLATRYDDLSRADVIVMNSAAEHDELSDLYSGRLAAIPGHEGYGFADQFQAGGERPCDILFTGRAFTPYMRDKAQQLFRMAGVDDPELNIQIFDGYVPDADFIELMSSAKSVPLFWRYGGGIQTRAFDAIRFGARALAPEQGICGALLGDDEDYYQSIGTEQPEEKIRLLLAARPNDDDLSGFAELAWPSPEREERFLKFCLYQTLLIPEREETSLPHATAIDLRGHDVATGVNIYTASIKHNLKDPTTGAQFNFAGMAGFYAAILAQTDQKLGNLCLNAFETGIDRFPDNAALAFNFARALWVFGKRDQAMAQFEKFLDIEKAWEFDPRRDALLSHRVRVLADMFPYGDFYHTAVDIARGREPGFTVINQFASTARTYLAQAALDNGDQATALHYVEQAVDLWPENFPAHQLSVAVLRRTGDFDRVLESFYAAVNLYPPLILDLLADGIEAELYRDNEAAARDILRRFVLFYGRCRKSDGTPLDATADTRDAAQKHRGLLSDWSRDMLDQMIESGWL
jgi:hypothetical protein